ncbi:hypothetical protein HPP92_025111 [Vanilla planifolia]|uniref:Uncharacterized protein n=1 Tax=Vanilla planifolia TaxID=51239 RepID=A0A835PPE5_VANPL|nr:hypothetical protein HPP92_025388 [Vanilla planifolia]KAG0453807.1 hypothetical protein HPP92_025111 [Vanilla planifolia]
MDDKGERSMSHSRKESWEEETEEERGKRARYESSSVELEIKLDRPLTELDPAGLKREIRRWARTVVRYARQLSRALSSASRHSSSVSSSFRDGEEVDDLEVGSSSRR